MANAMYPKFKEAMLSGAVDLTSVTVKAVLVDGADYTYSASHQFLSDVPSGGRVAISAALTSKTIASGVFDSADSQFSSVTGDVSEIIILFVDTGDPATSRLVYYFDTGMGNMPITPNGGNLPIQVNASGWFSIGG
jgi:hypothetical protein